MLWPWKRLQGTGCAACLQVTSGGAGAQPGTPVRSLCGEGKCTPSLMAAMPRGAASTLLPAALVSPSCLSSLTTRVFWRGGMMLEWEVFYAGSWVFFLVGCFF